MSNSNKPIKAEWIKELERAARLGNCLIAILQNHVSERGRSEGAIEVLKRIIKERDIVTKQRNEWCVAYTKLRDKKVTK